ncbi:MAG: autoinducer binding domain-containing protein [Burkholderiaceae bacterium]
MHGSVVNGDAGQGLGALTRSDGWLARALRGIARVAEAGTTDDVLLSFHSAAGDLGADAAVFMSFLQDDATLSSYRTLVACDPVWSATYAREQWFEDDPWLRHAMHDAEPVRSSEIVLRSPREEVFAQAAARAGFASAIVAPAPSTHGTSRVGVLALGSATPGFFEDEGYATLRVLTRALAMELHGWLARSILRELIDKAHITADDITLLRHEAAGHSSKVIAAAMHTEPKTIDCRFQRVSNKLGAPNRRAAVRLARLYGLL